MNSKRKIKSSHIKCRTSIIRTFLIFFFTTQAMIARAEALFNMGQVLLVILIKIIISSDGNNVVL